MRKLIRELFYVPKYGKVKERTLYARLTSSVTVIVLCLAAMGFTAYAYFSAGVTSTVKPITAASFEVEVQIVQDGVTLQPQVDGRYLLQAGTYQIHLQRSGTATTGYCKIGIGNLVYTSSQLGADQNAVNGYRNELKFTLVLTGAGSLNLSYTSCWGTAALYSAHGILDTEEDDYYIVDGEVLTVDIEQALAEIDEDDDPAENPAEGTKPSDPTEGTEPEATEPTEGPRGEIQIIVSAKDTLYSIGKTYGVSIENLMAYNGISDRNIIVTGSVLKIPPEGWTSEAETEGTEQEPSDPVSGTEPEATEPTEGPRGEIQIIVSAKDTLYSIGKTYGVSIEDIMAYNGLNDRDIIVTGSALKIPPKGWSPEEGTEATE